MKFYTEFFQRGKKVYIRGYDAAGKEELKVVDADADFFCTAAASPGTDLKLSQYKNLQGEPLYHISFEDSYEAKRFAKANPGTIYGNAMIEYNVVDELMPGRIDSDFSKIRTIFIDIETECESGFPQLLNPIEKVNCVTVVYRDKIYTMATGPCDDDLPENTQFIECKDEYTLFTRLKQLLCGLAPDIISGWHIEGFDIPYLVERSKVLYGDTSWARAISPFGILTDHKIDVFGEEITTYDFAGIVILDYLHIYQLLGKKQAQYSLDWIAQVELGDKKLPYEGTFKEFYQRDFSRFVRYNVQDTVLVSKLEEKRHFIALALKMAYQSKVRYRDIFQQVRMWEVAIFSFLKQRNIIAPMKVGNAKKEDFEGAFVRTPIPGWYYDVATFDVTSLYPSLIMMLNISPETYAGQVPDMNVEKFFAKEFDAQMLIDKNVSMSVNGALFDKTKKGFIVEMVEDLFNERAAKKAQMLTIEKEILKVKQEIKKRIEQEGAET